MIREAVDSVLRQDMGGMEPIVVDDGSTDGTVEKLKGYESVRIVTQPNRERGAARNRGALEANGDYLCFLDADDVMEPWAFRQFSQGVEEHPTGHVFSAEIVFWEEGTRRVRRQRVPRRVWGNLAEEALQGTVLPLPGLFISREAFEAVGGFVEEPSVAGSEDRILLAKLAQNYSITRLPRHCVRVREHPGRSMGQHTARLKSSLAARNIMLDEMAGGITGLDKAKQELVIAGDLRFRAAHAYALGDMREARQLLREAREILPRFKWVKLHGRLWCQTWLGNRGACLIRKVKQGLPLK